MKNLLLAGLCSSVLLVPSAASAKTFVLKSDPSGASMCFSKKGELAPLAHCESAQADYSIVRDPSGAPMCSDPAGDRVALDICEANISTGLAPHILHRLPDESAAKAAAQFVSAVEDDNARKFTALVHPRGIHHGRKKIRASAIASVVRTLGVRSFVAMPQSERWNVRVSGSWFSVFRGEGDGKTTVAYFEIYRGKWRLVQLARVSFAETATL